MEQSTSGRRRGYKGLWAEFLRTESGSFEAKRGERMKRLSERWREKMSGLVTVSMEYLKHMKKEHEEMKYLIAVKNAEIKDLKERLSYFEIEFETKRRQLQKNEDCEN